MLLVNNSRKNCSLFILNFGICLVSGQFNAPRAGSIQFSGWLSHIRTICTSNERKWVIGTKNGEWERTKILKPNSFSVVMWSSIFNTFHHCPIFRINFGSFLSSLRYYPKLIECVRIYYEEEIVEIKTFVIKWILFFFQFELHKQMRPACEWVFPFSLCPFFYDIIYASKLAIIMHTCCTHNNFKTIFWRFSFFLCKTYTRCTPLDALATPRSHNSVNARGEWRCQVIIIICWLFYVTNVISFK